jgi:hypothetical protein
MLKSQRNIIWKLKAKERILTIGHGGKELLGFEL